MRYRLAYCTICLVVVVAPLFGAVLFGLFCGAVVPLLPLLLAVDILPLYYYFLSTPGISGRTIDVIIVLVVVCMLTQSTPEILMLCCCSFRLCYHL